MNKNISWKCLIYKYVHKLNNTDLYTPFLYKAQKHNDEKFLPINFNVTYFVHLEIRSPNFWIFLKYENRNCD